MKRVLVITYYWPPEGGSGVQRWVKFAKYLPSFGWQPVIYTPSNPQRRTVDETLLSEIPREAEIIKRPINEPYGIYRKLMGKDSSTDMKTLTYSNTSGEGSLKQRVSLYIRSNFFIPDPRVWWVRPSVRFLKEYLKEHPVDVIVSTGPPQSMHLIGRNLVRETGLPWISDFRDPWTGMYWFDRMGLSWRSECTHRQMEKEVLDSSSVVLAVTPMVRDEFKKMTSSRVEMITNGYDEADFDQKAEEDGFFNVTHTGIFPVDGNPEALWKVLSQKCSNDGEFRSKLRIRLAGNTDPGVLDSIEKAQLSSFVVNRGYLSHGEAVAEQKSASLLILPLRNSPGYKAILPGKLFEYIAAVRPVLGIGQTDGAMAQLLRETEAGIVCDWNDENSIKSYIDSCWDKFRNGKLVGTAKEYEKYSRRNLTASLVDLLEDITK